MQKTKKLYMKKMIILLFRKLFAFILFSSFLSLLHAQTTVTLSTPGTGTWTVPCGVTSVTVEVWGAGGGGQGVTGNGNSGTGGGGSGGGYVKGAFAVSAGNVLDYSIGSGGDGTPSANNKGGNSWFINNTTLFSVGGNGAAAYANNTSGTGQNAVITGNFNTGAAPVSTYGGKGGDSSVGNFSGGGGSSAGTTTGNNASGQAGGAAPTNGYAGATGITGNGVGQNGNVGAGGSGAKKATGNGTFTGGKGGDGQIKITYTVTLPGTPMASSITGTSAILTWSGTGNFIVEYGPAGFTPGLGGTSGTGGTIASSSATSPYTLNGLVGGTPYDVYVRNVNCPTTGLYGSNSPKGTFTTTSTPCVTPTNPSGINFTGVSATTITVSFTPPGTAPSGGYVVFRSTSATAPVLTNGTVYTNGATYSLPGNSYQVVSNGTTVSIPQTGLTSNTRYYYYVFSQNTACSGQPFYSTGINGNQVTCPADPTGNTVTGITSTGSTLQWNASVGGGSAATINYLVEVTTNSDFTGPIAGSPFNNGTAVSKVITGLTSGTIYYYRIKANNGCSSNPGLTGSFTTSLAPCSGTPIGGTTGLSPSTGLPSSAFTATVTGDTAATGLNYQWQISDTGADPWFDISGATGASANLTAVPFNTATRYYRRKTTCGNSGLVAYSTVKTFVTTTASAYCAPSTSSPNSLYIKSFKFVGTLNNPSLGANTSGGNGYFNYTGLSPVAQQPDGSVVNIEAIASGNGNWKAWVDWNGDGDFDDNGEQVYRLTKFVTDALTFGFVIPPGQPAGKYRLRIKLRNNNSKSDFGPCDTFTNGETEDYSFEVVYDCPAKVDAINIVTTDGHRCGPGTVTLSAAGNGTTYRWYTSLTGGAPIHTGSTFTTPSISATTEYYVTAYNGACESAYRIPVTARIDPLPQITFSSTPSFCGADNGGAKINGSGDKFVDTKLNETFASGLGTFINLREGVYTGAAGDWQLQPSPFVPPASTDSPAGPYEGLAPALSSGYFGGNFAAIVTDIDRNTSIQNALTLTNAIDVTGFQNLNFDFDLYYFSITNSTTEGYLKIQYTYDTAATPAWNTLETITAITGNPIIWGKKKYLIPLPAPATSTQLKVRFLVYSYGYYSNGNGWKESITAVDNIKIYGDKPITTGFTWTGPPSMLYKSDCTTSLGNSKESEICIRPTDTQIENDISWNLTATAAFNNGCDASNSIVVPNNSKVYNTILSTDWSNAANWKPENIVPDATKCVIIKKPVIINAATDGLAKNITVESGGTLNINGSLKVTDWVKNNASAASVVVESDASLVQVNEAINTGNITAKRTLNLSAGRQQYNYLISPVEGQNLKYIYNGIDYVLYHNEANNFFYSSSGAYIKGRALAVKEPNKTAVAGGTPTVTATFTGYPTNGAFTYGIVNSNTANTAKRGFNLIGNPYPSNLDLIELYKINGGTGGNISSTFHLWDNRANSQTVQMGDNYGQQAYATFNAVTPPVGGTGIMATGDAGLAGTNKPTQYIKMGQGFMTQSKVASQQLKFDNTIRTTNKGTVSFFGKGAQETQVPVDRYWLNMVTPANLAAQIAVVYFEGGNNAFTDDDSSSMGGSDALYSIVDGVKVAINGRSSFTVTDVIPLGTAHFTGGNYTFALQEKEGVFANGQAIYLKDKQTGTLNNLSLGNYTFAASAGESAGRFEIVYQQDLVLATDGKAKEEIQVYRDGNSFLVKAQTKKITGLEVYDASGKLIVTMQPNSKKAVIDGTALANGMYLIKISQNGEVTSRKVLK